MTERALRVAQDVVDEVSGDERLLAEVVEEIRRESRQRASAAEGATRASRSPRHERLHFRLTSEEDAVIRQAALVTDTSISDFVVQAAVETARRVVDEDERTTRVTRAVFERVLDRLRDEDVEDEADTGLRRLRDRARRLTDDT